MSIETAVSNTLLRAVLHVDGAAASAALHDSPPSTRTISIHDRLRHYTVAVARARLYKKRYFVIPPSTATLRLDDLNAVYFAIGQLVHQTHSYTHHATCFKGYANSQWATRDRACRMRMPAWTVERTRLDNGTDVVYMMQHLDVWVVPTLKALASGVPGNSDAKYVVTGSLAGNNLLYYMFKYATKVHDKNQTNNLDTLVAALLRQRRSQVQRGLPRDADAAAAAPRATVSSTAAAVVINAATRIAGMVEFDLPLVHFCLLNGSSRGTFVTSHPAMVKLGLRAAVFNRWWPRAGSDRAADDDAEVVTRLRPDEALRLYHNDSPLGQYAYRPAIHDALSAGRFHDEKMVVRVPRRANDLSDSDDDDSDDGDAGGFDIDAGGDNGVAAGHVDVAGPVPNIAARSRHSRFLRGYPLRNVRAVTDWPDDQHAVFVDVPPGPRFPDELIVHGRPARAPLQPGVAVYGADGAHDDDVAPDAPRVTCPLCHGHATDSFFKPWVNLVPRARAPSRSDATTAPRARPVGVDVPDGTYDEDAYKRYVDAIDNDDLTASACALMLAWVPHRGERTLVERRVCPNETAVEALNRLVLETVVSGRDLNDMVNTLLYYAADGVVNHTLQERQAAALSDANAHTEGANAHTEGTNARGARPQYGDDDDDADSDAGGVLPDLSADDRAAVAEARAQSEVRASNQRQAQRRRNVPRALRSVVNSVASTAVPHEEVTHDDVLRAEALVPSQFGRAAVPGPDNAEVDDDDDDDDEVVLDSIDATQLRDTTATLAADAATTPRDLTIDGHARFHGLNTGQQLAFRYFALRLVARTSGVDGAHDACEFFDAYSRVGVMADEQQHILLIGEAGTGKSKVINAVRDFAAARGASSAIGVYAYTAIAALLVDGITMSSAARLRPRRRRRGQQQQQALHNNASQTTAVALAKIRAEFQNKHIIFIDEVYMVGASFLAHFSASISAALCETGATEAYGGIKTIVGCGDIFQAPPIADAAPWKTPTDAVGGDDRAPARRNDVAIGHRLYRRFDRVFLLWERMRARCPVLGNVARALRTRDGIPDWLLRQLNERATVYVPSAAESIVITYTNEERHTITDMLIDAAVTNLRNRVYFWDHVDVADNVPSPDLAASCSHSELDKDVLRQYARGNTGSRYQSSKAEKVCAPPSFACYVGMDVIVTKNHNFMLGVVNGARGKVRRICFEQGTQFKVRDDGATQCSAPPAYIVVEFSTPAGAPLEGYPQHQRPISRIRETGTATMGEYKIKYDYMSFAMRHGRVVTAHSIQAATYRHPILISNMLSHKNLPPELFVMALTRATTINDVYLMDPLTTAQARRCRAHEDKIIEYLRIVSMAFSTMRAINPVLDFPAIAECAGVTLDSSGKPVDTL